MAAVFVPTWHVLPPRSSSAAREVIDFASALGFPLDEHQEAMAELVYGWLDGTWAADDVLCVEPRQNGKTGAFQVFLLADNFLFGVECHTWTAHLFDTTRETFKWMVETIEGNPELSRRLKGRISKSSGNFGWKLKSGAECRFRARSKGGQGRGVSGNVLTWDEALKLPSMAAAALGPTLSAKKHTQMRFLSSQGDDKPEADLLRELRDAGRSDNPGRLAYMEMAAKPRDCANPRCSHLRGTPGCWYDNREAQREANFAMVVGRMSESNVDRDRRTLTPPMFGMERLGQWIDPPPISLTTKVDAELWHRLGSDEEVLFDGVLTAAFVDVAWNMSNAAIAFAQWTPEGDIVAQLVGYEPGDEWVGDFLRAEMKNLQLGTVVMQRLSPAQSLHDELEAKKDDLAKKLELWGAGDLASACASLERLLGEIARGYDEADKAGEPYAPALRHTNDGPVSVALTAQAARELATVWLWDRKVPLEKFKVDASPLVAITGAIGALQRLPKPNRVRIH